MEPSLAKFALLCFTSLLSIINPLSGAPMYLALTDGFSAKQRGRTLRAGVVTAFAGVALIAAG